MIIPRYGTITFALCWCALKRETSVAHIRSKKITLCYCCHQHVGPLAQLGRELATLPTCWAAGPMRPGTGNSSNMLGCWPNEAGNWQPYQHVGPLAQRGVELATLPTCWAAGPMRPGNGNSSNMLGRWPNEAGNWKPYQHVGPLALRGRLLAILVTCWAAGPMRLVGYQHFGPLAQCKGQFTIHY